MNTTKKAQQREIRRKNRIRAKIQGTRLRPRLCVFRSQQHTYAQLVNDETGKVIASASDLSMKAKGKKRMEISKEVGKNLAEKVLKANIKNVVFDRSGYKYHGNVKAVAEGAREGGLQF